LVTIGIKNKIIVSLEDYESHLLLTEVPVVKRIFLLFLRLNQTDLQILEFTFRLNIIPIDVFVKPKGLFGFRELSLAYEMMRRLRKQEITHNVAQREDDNKRGCGKVVKIGGDYISC